ncbi:MAG: VWA domain-containing protein [Ruminococcus sp.]|nr:VWA domain-containing protein [Ruminococcus sp.]
MKINNIKRIAALAAALTMCLSAVSCGSSDNSGEKADAPAASGKSAGIASAGDEVTNGAEPETLIPDGGSTGESAETGKESGFALDAEMYGMADGKTVVKGDMIEGDFAGEAPAPAAGSDEIIADPGSGETPVYNDPQAFVLTAGEWNDNDNWGFFTNLVKNGTISFPAFGLDPTRRIAVTVTKDGAPAKDQPVELLDSEGKVLWAARSDKNGKAYVFYGKDQTPVSVKSNGAEVEVTGGSDNGQGRAGTTEVALEVSDSSTLTETQVMFILDTTGSMFDEIAYLQMEFSSIAKEVDDDHTTFSANFYRDEGDDYVTKCNPFTSDVKAVQSAINQENADGGGDYPEAVAQILEETISNNQEWSENANKIAFLIFDAPPHEGTEQQLDKAVRTAAAKGIHIVPVVSSGAERDTELFGRAVAAQTASNYVFLTDDSGIGGEHLDPIIGDYEVELLHDVIVRNITELRS